MLLIRDLESKISRLEELLHDISEKFLANVLYEDVSPSKLLADSENYINALKNVAEEIKDAMLILKPERAPSIRRAFRNFTQSINNFVKVLKETEETRGSSRLSLEHLKVAVKQGQDLVGLAREIIKDPSKSITEILRLKEISETKDYILRVSVPESIHMRLEYLKRSLESFKVHVSGLDQSARDLLKHIDKVREEISKFQAAT